jgi:hypothetical protein
MEQKKIGLFKKSWLLTKSSAIALKLDKELLALPIIGFVYSTILLAPLVLLYVFNPKNILYLFVKENIGTSTTIHFQPLGYLLMVFSLAASAVISVYITGATITGALDRFKGGDPSIRSTLKKARSKLGPLTYFALFSFGIGYILNFIADRVPFIARMFVWLASMAWAVASFFAIPVIMDEQDQLGPIDATKKSIELIKKTWGESLVATASIGIISFLVGISYFFIASAISLLIIVGLKATILGIVVASVFLIGLIVLMLVFSMMSGYVKAAVYYYATTGESPVAFSKSILEEAFTIKKAKKVFSK